MVLHDSCFGVLTSFRYVFIHVHKVQATEWPRFEKEAADLTSLTIHLFLYRNFVVLCFFSSCRFGVGQWF